MSEKFSVAPVIPPEIQQQRHSCSLDTFQVQSHSWNFQTAQLNSDAVITRNVDNLHLAIISEGQFVVINNIINSSSFVSPILSLWQWWAHWWYIDLAVFCSVRVFKYFRTLSVGIISRIPWLVKFGGVKMSALALRVAAHNMWLIFPTFTGHFRIS